MLGFRIGTLVCFKLLVILGLMPLSMGNVFAEEREPLAHWKLTGDTKDSSSSKLDATMLGMRLKCAQRAVMWRCMPRLTAA